MVAIESTLILYLIMVRSLWNYWYRQDYHLKRRSGGVVVTKLERYQDDQIEQRRRGKLMNNRARGKRIMVVDDESDLTLYYRMSLEYYGYEVETFNESRKALSSFKPDYYDLIILDIKMPDMNGFELHGKIKEIDPNAKTCFLTATELYHKEFRTREYCALDKELFIRK
ncbi:MAG: response regulator, partial [Nitrososphaeraceae archaeon]